MRKCCHSSRVTRWRGLGHGRNGGRSSAGGEASRDAGDACYGGFLVPLGVWHFFGDAKRFLRLPRETADFSLTSLCVPEIQSELKTLAYRVNHEGSSHATGVPCEFDLDGRRVRLQLVLRRLPINYASDDHCLMIRVKQCEPREQGRLRLVTKLPGHH